VGLVSGDDVVGRDFLDVVVTNWRKLSRILTAALRPDDDTGPCTSSSRCGKCSSDADVDGRRLLTVLRGPGGADRPRVSDRAPPCAASCSSRRGRWVSVGRSGGGGGVDRRRSDTPRPIAKKLIVCNQSIKKISTYNNDQWCTIMRLKAKIKPKDNVRIKN